MLTLQLPESSTMYPAAVFGQDGTFITAGAREYCETFARRISGLYCLIVDGAPVIRFDFEDEDE